MRRTAPLGGNGEGWMMDDHDDDLALWQGCGRVSEQDMVGLQLPHSCVPATPGT